MNRHRRELRRRSAAAGEGLPWGFHRVTVACDIQGNTSRSADCRRAGGSWLGCLALSCALLLASCGRPASPPSAAPAPCPESPVRKLLEAGQLLAAWAMVHTTKSSAEIRCPSNAARNALEEEVRASLEEPALPPEVAVRRAELLRRDGQDAEAQSVVDRSFHAARAQGKRIELVPAWVSDVQYVQFQPPDRFVVSHGAGTSTFTADGLRETRRCPIDSWNLSPQGKYAHLQENTILDLD